jgi:hypothetical protein
MTIQSVTSTSALGGAHQISNQQAHAKAAAAKPPKHPQDTVELSAAAKAATDPDHDGD